MLALEQSAEKWPFSAGGGVAPPGYGSVICYWNDWIVVQLSTHSRAETINMRAESRRLIRRIHGRIVAAIGCCNWLQQRQHCVFSAWEVGYLVICSNGCTGCNLTGTLKQRGYGPLYSNTVTLVHWLLMGALIQLVQRWGAWAGCGPAQSPPRYTKCNSPTINGRCTNFVLFDVAV